MRIDYTKDSESTPASIDIDYFEEANAQINKLLDALFLPEANYDGAKLLGLLDHFCNNPNIRIPYYQVTVFVNKVLEGEPTGQSELANAKVRLRQLKVDEVGEETQRSKFMIKLLDHLDLAEHQFTSLSKEVEKTLGIVDKAGEESRKAEEVLRVAYKDAANRIEKLQHTIYSQIIAIVAIFTGIAFVLFGGVSALSSITEAVKANTSGFLRVLAYVSIIGAFVIGALLLFFKFVMILTTKTPSAGDRTMLYGKWVFGILVGLAFIFGIVSFVSEYQASLLPSFHFPVRMNLPFGYF